MERKVGRGIKIRSMSKIKNDKGCEGQLGLAKQFRVPHSLLFDPGDLDGAEQVAKQLVDGLPFDFGFRSQHDSVT